MENQYLHDRMMSILRQRAANGEGEGEEYGGWAKGTLMPKENYYTMMRKKGYTDNEIRLKRNSLLNRRRAKGLSVKIIKPKTKAKTKAKTRAKTRATTKTDFNSMNLIELKAFLKRKKVKGYSKLKKAQLIQLAKNVESGKHIVVPAKRKRTRKAKKSGDSIDNVIKIIESRVDEEGKLPKAEFQAINTLKKISTQYQRTGKRAHLPIPAGMMKKIAEYEAAKIRDPKNAANYEHSIRYLLASGEGDDYEDYYDMY